MATSATDLLVDVLKYHEITIDIHDNPNEIELLCEIYTKLTTNGVFEYITENIGNNNNNNNNNHNATNNDTSNTANTANTKNTKNISSLINDIAKFNPCTISELKSELMKKVFITKMKTKTLTIPNCKNIYLTLYSIITSKKSLDKSKVMDIKLAIFYIRLLCKNLKNYDSHSNNTGGLSSNSVFNSLTKARASAYSAAINNRKSVEQRSTASAASGRTRRANNNDKPQLKEYNKLFVEINNLLKEYNKLFVEINKGYENMNNDTYKKSNNMSKNAHKVSLLHNILIFTGKYKNLTQHYSNILRIGRTRTKKLASANNKKNSSKTLEIVQKLEREIEQIKKKFAKIKKIQSEIEQNVKH